MCSAIQSAFLVRAPVPRQRVYGQPDVQPAAQRAGCVQQLPRHSSLCAAMRTASRSARCCVSQRRLHRLTLQHKQPQTERRRPAVAALPPYGDCGWQLERDIYIHSCIQPLNATARAAFGLAIAEPPQTPWALTPSSHVCPQGSPRAMSPQVPLVPDVFACSLRGALPCRGAAARVPAVSKSHLQMATMTASQYQSEHHQSRQRKDCGQWTPCRRHLAGCRSSCPP